jgi:AcrR family transcriptional regulator
MSIVHNTYSAVGKTMEENHKEDRRVTRTKSALNHALSELVKEKGYESVTVEDITTRANLGRTTFYLHYKDKEDLLLDGLEERLSNLVNDVTKHPIIFWFKENNNYLINSIFETIKDNADVFQMITREQSNKVYDRFRNMITRVMTKLIADSPWAQKKVSSLSIPIDYVIDYFSGAIWASIVWWASNGFSQSTDEMAKSFRTLFFPGLLRILKVKNFTELVEVVTH